MSSQKSHGAIRDLVEEAKKRIVFLVICVVGLSYLMSLTSSSVWVNLPVAASLILVLRYLSLDFETKRKTAAYNSKPSSGNNTAQKKHAEGRKIVDRTDWRMKVNSPVVENAIDHLTNHIVAEWVTDLWYSKLTPDKEAPEELVYMMNGVLGEFSARMRNINLIDLLTRDLVHLVCTHLELFRVIQAKIVKQDEILTIEHRDMKLKLALASENKLHPALFSAEAEHKVLQHMMDDLIALAFKPEDLQCSFFRFVTRELLACAVMRPVLNLASPRFINERIESVVVNLNKSKQAANPTPEATQQKQDGQTKISSDHFSRFLDPSVKGVELVQLKNDLPRKSSAKDEVLAKGNLSKDPLLSIDTRSTRSWGSLPMNQTGDEVGLPHNRSRREWGDMLDIVSQRKTQALAPEHFDNMWTKGRDYKRNEGENHSSEQVGPTHKNNTKVVSKPNETANKAKVGSLPSASLANIYEDDDGEEKEEADLRSTTSYTSEEEDNCVTGLDSPGTKVWDGRNNRNTSVSPIHHPLEAPQGRYVKKVAKGPLRYQQFRRTASRKRSRPSNSSMHVWQEIERTSFLSGDGQDILRSSKENGSFEDFSDDSETESLGRAHSGDAASSSALSSAPDNTLVGNPMQNSLAVDSFYKLRCEVLGANIVKSGSRTFAVYSISVSDITNNSWSIKRRFRHFEELHRRLKMFSEYNLHLPPKHFLSTGLDVLVIRERCKLLYNYLKNLMQLPSVSGSIEVWDFLSVDSQTYYFTNSFSIIETLSVDLGNKPSEKSKGLSNLGMPGTDHKEHLRTEGREPTSQMKNNAMPDGFRLNAKAVSNSPTKNPTDPEKRAQKDESSRKNGKAVKGRESDSPEMVSPLLLDPAADSTIPTEWVPPNVSIPILDLVDCIFQVQDGGWIRRKAFWVAKQVLQLGMGDAFDDWLIERIQLLRKGSIVASGLKKLEQILWPDGIFLTKHPKRRAPPPPSSPSQSQPNGQNRPDALSPRVSDNQQQEEANRREKLVYEIMIEKAPAAIVGLVGRREYEQCAKDLYFFLQSSVCVKQLAFDLLELLLLSTFPELDDTFKQLHLDKHKFGEFKPS